MAYRSRSTRRGPVRGRRSGGGRRMFASARRTGGYRTRRAASRRTAARGQTIRIVLEQPSAVGRPQNINDMLISHKAAAAPRKAQF